MGRQKRGAPCTRACSCSALGCKSDQYQCVKGQTFAMRLRRERLTKVVRRMSGLVLHDPHRMPFPPSHPSKNRVDLLPYLNNTRLIVYNGRIGYSLMSSLEAASLCCSTTAIRFQGEEHQPERNTGTSDKSLLNSTHNENRIDILTRVVTRTLEKREGS